MFLFSLSTFEGVLLVDSDNNTKIGQDWQESDSEESPDTNELDDIFHATASNDLRLDIVFPSLKISSENDQIQNTLMVAYKVPHPPPEFC